MHREVGGELDGADEVEHDAAAGVSFETVHDDDDGFTVNK